MSKLLKIVGITMVVAVVGMMVVGAVAFAQGPEGASFGRGMGMSQGIGFVDEDGDGVCDNCGTGQRLGRGTAGFVDEDNDGVCDYLGTGQHSGNGLGSGNGNGPGFVDEDGDGVCDNCSTAQQLGRGMARGWRYNQ